MPQSIHLAFLALILPAVALAPASGDDMAQVVSALTDLSSASPTVAAARVPSLLLQIQAAVLPAPSVASPPSGPAGWLQVQGDRIFLAGQVWRGRGVNMMDTRFNNAWCPQAPEQPGDGNGAAVTAASERLRANEINRRIDAVVALGARLIRIPMDDRPMDGQAFSGSRVLNDPAYLAALQQIVAHVHQYPGVFIDLSLWLEPTGTQSPRIAGWVPGLDTVPVWALLAKTFALEPQVIFGLANETDNGRDVASLQATAQVLHAIVDAIRSAEAAAQAPAPHVIKLPALWYQGRCCGNDLTWWAAHPMQDVSNIAYDIHLYSSLPVSQKLLAAGSGLPVMVTEFAPNAGPMNLVDALELQGQLEALSFIPYAAWDYGTNIDCNLLQPPDNRHTCDIGMPLDAALEPTWGLPFTTFLRGAGATEKP